MPKKHKKSHTAPRDGHLGSLIDRLGPINNACRGAEGIDKVEHLWDLGDALLRFDPEASDDLLWEIAEKSYLTRDLLRYALIIRRSWSQKAQLRQSFPRLTQYTLFREALPFLKGDRCGISDEIYAEIVARLKDGNPQEVKEFLLSLKAKKIGRKHKKGQAVAKMAEVAQKVQAAIRQMVDLAVSDSDQVASARNSLGDEGLLALSQRCMAVAEDSPPPTLSHGPGAWPEPFATLSGNLEVVGRASRDDRAGFRKALGSLALLEAADLLNALRSDERLEQWKRRRGMKLRL